MTTVQAGGTLQPRFQSVADALGVGPGACSDAVEALLNSADPVVHAALHEALLHYGALERHDHTGYAIVSGPATDLVFHHQALDAGFLQGFLGMHPDWYPQDAYVASWVREVLSHATAGPLQPVR